MSNPIKPDDDEFDFDAALESLKPLGEEEDIKPVGEEKDKPLDEEEDKPLDEEKDKPLDEEDKPLDEEKDKPVEMVRVPPLGILSNPIKGPTISRFTTVPPSQDFTLVCDGCQKKCKHLPLTQKPPPNSYSDCSICRGLRMDARTTIGYSYFCSIERELKILKEVIGSNSFNTSFTLINKTLQKIGEKYVNKKVEKIYIEVDKETVCHIVVNKFHISELLKKIDNYIKKMDQRKSNHKVQFGHGGMMSASEGITYFNYINYVNFYNMLCEARAMYTVAENMRLI